MDHYAGIDLSLELSIVCVVGCHGTDRARGQGGERAGALVARGRSVVTVQWALRGDADAIRGGGAPTPGEKRGTRDRISAQRG
jgi:hypothetical protein